jgi:hypothetical protein
MGMITAGFALFILGLATDLNAADWSQNLGFITNIWAGLTGFLIGAPVALVVLATFTSAREEKATLDRVNRLSLLAWYSFRDLVEAFGSDERYESIVEQARDITKWYDEASTAIDQYIERASEMVDSPDDSKDDVALAEHHENLKRIEENFRTAVNATINKFNFETEDEWAQIVGSWRVLDQYVRLQRLEQSLEWFDKTPDAGFRKWMSRDGNPVQELVDALEIRRYTSNTSPGVETMRQALDTLASYTRTDRVNLGEYLLYTGNIFSSDRSNTFNIKRDAAQIFILDVKRFIGLVEISYWPRSQVVPTIQSLERELTAHEWIGSLQTPDGQKQFEKDVKRVMAKQYQEKLLRRKK